MAEKTVTYKFAAEVNQMLASIAKMQDAYKKTGTEGQKESAKLALSADQIKAKISALGKEIGGLKDVNAIRQKQQEMKDYEKALEGVLGKTKEVGSVSQGAFAGSFLGTLAGGIAAKGMDMISGAIGRVSDAMIGGNAEMETYQASFETMLGSVDKANAVLGEVKTLAAETPFEFPELAGATRNLIAFSVKADEAVPMLKRLGDLASGVNAPVGQLAELFGKARVSGTLYAEDINQLVGRGIPVITEFAKILGVSESQVKKMASEGKVSYATLEKALENMTNEGGQFNGMMEKQSKTFAGLSSTMQDVMGEIGRTIGAPVFDEAKKGLEGILATLQNPKFQAAIKALASGLASIIGAITDNIEIVGTGVVAYGAYMVVLNGAAIKKAALTAATKLGINSTMLYIAAITAAVVALRAYAKSEADGVAKEKEAIRVEDELIKKSKEANATRQDRVNSNKDLLEQYEQLASKANRTAAEERALRDNMMKINEQYPSLIDSTKSFAENLTSVKDEAEKTKGELEKLRGEMTELDKKNQDIQIRRAQLSTRSVQQEMRETLSAARNNAAQNALNVTNRQAAREIMDITGKVAGATADRLTQASMDAMDAIENLDGVDETTKNKLMGRLHDLVAAQDTLNAKIDDTVQGRADAAASGEDKDKERKESAGSVFDLEQKIAKLEEERKKYVVAGSEAYAKLSKVIEGATENLERLKLVGERLSDSDRTARVLDGIGEYVEEQDAALDAVVAAEVEANDRIRQLRIEMIDERRRQLLEELRFKLDLLNLEEISEEERLLKKQKLDREYGKSLADLRRDEAREQNKRREQFEDRYARPVADAMTNMLKSFADSSMTTSERTSAFFGNMKNVALDAVSGILSGLLTQGVMALAQMVGLVAAQTPIAAATGAAWAGPAALASTATFGAAAAAGATGLASTFALAQLMAAPKVMMAEGGILTRPTFAVAGEAGAEGFIPMGQSIPIFGKALRYAIDGITGTNGGRRTRIGQTRERPVLAEASVSVFQRGGRASTFRRQRGVF